MLTSARMWLESIRNWITEILGSTTNPQYVDVGVQTNATSLWGTVKQWFLEVCSIRSSELSSLGYKKVIKWRTDLDSNQSVTLPDSESPLDSTSVVSDSVLQKVIVPNDSASNISEEISKGSTNLQEVEKKVYDITDPVVLNGLLDDPTVYSYYDHIEHIHYVISDAVLSVDPSIVYLII